MVIKRILILSSILFFSCSTNVGSVESTSSVVSLPSDSDLSSSTSSESSYDYSIDHFGAEICLGHGQKKISYIPLGVTVQITFTSYNKDGRRVDVYLDKLNTIYDDNELEVVSLSEHYIDPREEQKTYELIYTLKTKAKTDKASITLSYSDYFREKYDFKVIDVTAGVSFCSLMATEKYYDRTFYGTHYDYPSDLFVEKANDLTELKAIARKWLSISPPTLPDGFFNDNYMAVMFLFHADYEIFLDGVFEDGQAVAVSFIQKVHSKFFWAPLFHYDLYHHGVLFLGLRRGLGYAEYENFYVYQPIDQ